MTRITGINFNAIKSVFSNFKGDLFGGITAGVVALPLALAFGVASGVGATAGLYGAIIVGLFAALFGGTKPQVSGPTGPMTVVMASIIVSNPGNYDLIFATIALSGLFQIALGFLKVGKLVRYVPYPVISGFMCGIGVIIIILQINPLLGLDVQGSPLKTLMDLGASLKLIDMQTLIIGVMTLLIMFLTPKKTAQKVPPALIALISMTIVSIFLGFNIKTIGEIPTGLPSLHFPLISMEDFMKSIPFAITLSILGAVDSLLTSIVADSVTKSSHNPNKELIGQGIGNMLAGLFGGIAGAGATMRTVVNIKSGGRTPLSGVIHSLFLTVILLGAAPLAAKVPMAVLAGILIKVGVDIIDYKFLKIIKHVPKYDLAVMIIVFALTVFNDLIFAVGTGIVLSCILFTSQISHHFKAETIDIKDFSQNETLENIEILSKHKLRELNIYGEFFFGSASKILSSLDDLSGTEYLIINCKMLHDLDISAMFALEDIIFRLQDKRINILLIVSCSELYKKLMDLGTIKSVNIENIFYDETSAIEYAHQLILKNPVNSVLPDANTFANVA